MYAWGGEPRRSGVAERSILYNTRPRGRSIGGSPDQLDHRLYASDRGRPSSVVHTSRFVYTSTSDPPLLRPKTPVRVDRPFDDQGAFNIMLSAALDAGDPHRVFYILILAARFVI